MTTLVIDVGQDIIGIYCVEGETYVPHRSGRAIGVAIQRIKTADEVVTYSGSQFRDLEQLGRFAGEPGDLSLKGVHTDMSRVCWAPIQGKGLRNTYSEYFGDPPDCPFANVDGCGEYEKDNRRDVFMTFKLWERWKQGALKTLE